jgi:hypothetical protein
LETKEKELLESRDLSKKKIDTLRVDYSTLQKSLLTELYKKILRIVTPLEFKVFSNKFLKLKDHSSNDSLESMINNISDNEEM